MFKKNESLIEKHGINISKMSYLSKLLALKLKDKSNTDFVEF